MKKILFVLMLLVLSVSVFAQVPNYQDKYVNDFANILNSEQREGLRELFLSVDQSTTAEMTLLTVDTAAPMAMSQYAQEVFDKWKIGKADKDNGLLILYAKQENKIWVSTGYGLEGILPDSKVGRILDETYVPERDANNTAVGILLAAAEYANVISENADEVRSGQASPSSGYTDTWFTLMIVLFFLVVPVFTAISNYMIRPKCKKCKCRMKLIKSETYTEKKKGAFGIIYDVRYIERTYVCPKCNCIVTKKTKVSGGYGPMLFLGGGGGGGFGGGGFGGGGGGGGGGGR